MTALRNELLQGRTIALGGAPGEIRDRLVSLGASVSVLDWPPELDDEQAVNWVSDRAPLDALVHDPRLAFATGGQADLTAAVEQTWRATAAVANGALIPAGNGGKIVLIAPRAQAGAFADAARSALENLARTLSVEWARYAITTTAIWPGENSTEHELGELVAFLLSPAGDYYSGCRFELGAV